MPHPLNSITEQAWEAIKLPGQPEYDSLGVDYRGTLYGWAEYALLGQPIEAGDHPGARFKRKIVELNAALALATSGAILHLGNPDQPVGVWNGAKGQWERLEELPPSAPFFQEIPVTVESDTIHVPSFEVPSTVDDDNVLSEFDPEVHVFEDPPDVAHLKGQLPTDFPFYDKLFDAGIKTHPQLRKALDSGVHIPGIGPAAETKIVDRLVLEAQK